VKLVDFIYCQQEKETSSSRLSGGQFFDTSIRRSEKESKYFLPETEAVFKLLSKHHWRFNFYAVDIYQFDPRENDLNAMINQILF